MYLRDYYSILREKNLPKYLSTKRTLIDADLDLSLENLWKAHRERRRGKTSLLDLKIEIAERIYDNCEFCERRCKLSRREKRGTCKVKKSKIASEFAHHGEEAPLVPSHTIFFSGCNFKCVFCQNWDISQNLTGRFFEPEEIARLIEKRNLKNVNFVVGEPTPNLVYILKVLRFCEAKIPVVWNSNLYMTFEVMELLDGVVDLYLTDFNYGKDECDKKYSK
ncbi:MAG: radical SAM protein, partial [Candidatus Methanofastidiosia archaeon]